MLEGALEDEEGRSPPPPTTDVGSENRGYDVESRNPASDRLRMIEVKGRAGAAETITVTRNELLCGLNAQETSTQVADGRAHEPRYVSRPFDREPDSGPVSVNFSVRDLTARATQQC